jgi:4-hydroxybutyrate CoA-transferase
MTAEDAVGMIKSGDRVAVATPHGGEPVRLLEVLSARIDLRDVDLRMVSATTDYPFFHSGFEDTFQLTFGFVSLPVRQLLDARRADYCPMLFSLVGKAEREGRPGIRGTDVFLVNVSPPDKHGYCSFGASVWSKRWYLESAKVVIAQVDSNQIRTYGDSLVHISEVDYFVECPAPGLRVDPPVAEDYIRDTAQYVGSLVCDGDTLALGAGALGFNLCNLGVLDDRQDLGYFSENMLPGVVRLVQKGVMTSRHATLHPGKIVATNLDTIGNREELEFVDGNPMFEVYPQEHVVNILNAAAHENLLAINSAMSIDFTGQIASESIGHRMYTGSGGQPELHMGAMLGKGGRAITTLRSTTSDGSRSRIVPSLDPGTVVTIPRNFADYVVTEYGVASLLGKTQRERANELISIAHPNFRAELRKEASKLF